MAVWLHKSLHHQRSLIFTRKSHTFAVFINFRIKLKFSKKCKFHQYCNFYLLLFDLFILTTMCKLLINKYYSQPSYPSSGSVTWYELTIEILVMMRWRWCGSWLPTLHENAMQLIIIITICCTPAHHHTLWKRPWSVFVLILLLFITKLLEF